MRHISWLISKESYRLINGVRVMTTVGHAKANPAWIYADEINLTWIDDEPVITVSLREIMIPFTRPA